MLSEHVDVVRSVIRSVAFRQGLAGTALEELESAVWIRLIDHDYRAIRQFRGDASFRTFLRVVVTRLLLDLRASAWGRWRPSALARSRGKSAIRFESLVFRDGYGVEQAREVLNSRGETISDEDVAALAGSLRSTPRRFIPLEEGPEPCQEAQLDLSTERDQRVKQTRHLSAALRKALSALPAADRELLQLRHAKGLKVATIARELKEDQTRLYRRLHGLHRTVRRQMESAGITSDVARELVGRNDVDLVSVL
jgi:RNA polymerase sigma factor (sigma-70 family)